MTSPRMPSGATAPMLAAWKGFWFREIPPQVYAALRIGLGSVGLLVVIGVADLSTYWIPGGLEPANPPWARRLLVDVGLGEVAGVTLFLLSVGSSLAMIVGYKSSLAVPVAFAAALLQISWNRLPHSGASEVHRALLFCLMWVETGDVWSLDSWLARRATPAAPASTTPTQPIWPLRLMRFQIGLLYLSTGLWKLFGEAWRDGSALFYVLNNNEFRRFPSVPPGVEFDWVWTILTYVTLFWELTFPFMLFQRHTRAFALGLGVLMHLGMGIFLELGTFSLVMLVSYLSFLDPQWVSDRSVSVKPDR